MGFSRQEYWSGLPFPSLGGIFPTQGSNPGLLPCRQILYRLRAPTLAGPKFQKKSQAQVCSGSLLGLRWEHSLKIGLKTRPRRPHSLPSRRDGAQKDARLHTILPQRVSPSWAAQYTAAQLSGWQWRTWGSSLAWEGRHVTTERETQEEAVYCLWWPLERLWSKESK